MGSPKINHRHLDSSSQPRGHTKNIFLSPRGNYTIIHNFASHPVHQAGCTPPLRLPSPPLAMWCSMMQPRLQCHEDIFRPGQCHMGWHILSIAQSCANVDAWHPPWLPLDSTRFTKAKHHCNQIALLNPNVLHKSHSALDIICLWLFIHLSISFYIFAFCSFLRQRSWHDDVCNSDDKTWLTNGTLGHINNYWARFYPLVIWHNYGQPPFFTGKSWIFYGLSSIANSKFTGWYTWWIFQPLDGQHASCLPVARRPP